MRWALLYRASPPITGQESDERVPELTQILARGGCVPVTVQPRGGGEHLSVLCEGGTEAPFVELPGLELVAATELEDPPELPDPPRAEPDPTVIDPQPAPLQRVRVRGERELDVVFGRGVVQRLHSVSVEESPDEIVVTVWVGTFPDLPERVLVTLQLILETVRVNLDEPLGGRPVRDGAPPRRS